MPDFVYALHDFVPENEDELSFKAGERIEVIERDDLYQDGWWQGKNLEGVTGLFPQSYTAPSTSNILAASTPTTAVTPMQKVDEEPDNAVMQATLTDVQEAIEQLGGHNNDHDHDASRSFSFASSHGDVTDKELDTEDEGAADPENWHRGARKLLAENARREMEKRRSQEERPPIVPDMVMSDESEPEDGDDYQHTRRFSPLLHKHQGSVDTIPAVGLGSLAAQPVKEEPHAEEQAQAQDLAVPRPSKSPDLARAHSPVSALKTPTPPSQVFPLSSTPPRDVTDFKSRYDQPEIVVPTPQDHTGYQPEIPLQIHTPNQVPLPHSPAPLEPRITPPPTPPMVRHDSTPKPEQATLSKSNSLKPNPTEWSVQQVVDWLKSKGFDDSVCDKFVENEISGDVLLDIDNQVLKDELGITAFGKRKKIEHAIMELRRPASLSSANSMHFVGNSTSTSHSHQPSVSTAISLNSPLSSNFVPHGASVTSVDSPPHNGEINMTPASPDFGILEPHKKGTLNSFSSESALRSNESADRSTERIPEGVLEEERDVISEGESNIANAAKSRRRRVFGKSFDSMSSRGHSPRDSKEFGSNQPSSPYAPKRSSYEEKYKNGVKASEQRLSFFSNTLGKTRKPAPRSTNGSVQNGDDDKPSNSTLGRLIPGHGLHGLRRPSGRPSTAQGIEGRNTSGSFPPPSTVLVKKRNSGPGERSVDKPIPALPDPTPSDLVPEKSILEQIGKADHSGWLRKKGERYNTWKLRYLVLKGPHLYYLRSDSRTETKIKGYINIRGYKVLADENVNPGRYGFRIIHEQERPHYFSSEESITVREWMKALMKATIGRDYTKPVISSCNIPTIPLMVAQTMNPAPRPPSPTARDATQRALRRENPNQLSTRDAQVLMGLGTESNSGYLPERASVDDFHIKTNGHSANYRMDPQQTPRNAAVPPRPSRNARNSTASMQHVPDHELVEWANRHLPYDLRFNQNTDVEISYGLQLLRIAEDIKGRPCEPPIPDEAFPSNAHDERLDGLFRLFDMLLDENVKMGTVSINDVRQGRPDKIVQLLKALKSWEEKRESLGRSIAGPGAVTAGGYMANLV